MKYTGYLLRRIGFCVRETLNTFQRTVKRKRMSLSLYIYMYIIHLNAFNQTLRAGYVRTCFTKMPNLLYNNTKFLQPELKYQKHGYCKQFPESLHILNIPLEGTWEAVPGRKFHVDFEPAIKHTKFLQPEGKC